MYSILSRFDKFLLLDTNIVSSLDTCCARWVSWGRDFRGEAVVKIDWDLRRKTGRKIFMLFTFLLLIDHFCHFRFG